ncbi:14592_t:CDS:2, partial [Acaulospora colombiana]
MPTPLFSQNGVDDVNTTMDSMPNVKLHKNKNLRRQLIFTSHDQKQQQHVYNGGDMMVVDNDNDNYNSSTNSRHSVNNHRHLVSLPRRKSSVLEISSLLCELPESSQEDGSFSGLDDASTTTSQLGDAESLGSPSSFHKNREDSSSTPATSPPLSPNVGNNRNSSNDSKDHNTSSISSVTPYETVRPVINCNSERQDVSRYGCEPSWKRVCQDNDHSARPVLPPIRSFTSLPDLRSESSSNDHGNLDSRKSSLEQFAAISEVYRSSSPSISHAEITSRLQQSAPPFHRSPPEPSGVSHLSSSPLTPVQPQQSLVRRSSFDLPQTRYAPYTPSSLNPFPNRLLSLDQRRHSDLSGLRNSGQAITDHPYNGGSSYPAYFDRDDSGRGYHSPNASAFPHQPRPYPHFYHGYPSPNSVSHSPAKRKRANPNQLKVLNEVFQQTFFPSTEQRIQLGKQLGMSPRTVQIWFQNKRQSWRSKTRATSSAPNKDDDNQGDGEMANGQPTSRRSSNFNLSEEEDKGQRSIPNSPLGTPPHHPHHHGDYFSHGAQVNGSGESVNPPPSATSGSNSYFAQQSSSTSSGDYYRSNNGHAMNSGAADVVSTTPSPLPPPSSMTTPLPPFGQSQSNNSQPSTV